MIEGIVNSAYEAVMVFHYAVRRDRHRRSTL